MKNYGTLLRLMTLNSLSLLRPGSFKRDDGKLDISKIVQLIAVIFGLGVLLVMVIGIEILCFMNVNALNHPELLPAMALLMGMMGTLLMSFFYVLSQLYFSRDSIWMSYLPLTSRTVLLAKLTEIWIGEALISIGLLMPAFVMYGRSIGADALYYVRALLLALLSPMVPIAVMTLLSTLLAGVITRMRSSTVLTSALSVGFVFLIVGVEMLLIPRIPEDADMAWIMTQLQGKETLLQTMTAAFPPARWGVHGLTGSWTELSLFALLSVGSIGLCLLLLGKNYLKLCVSQSEQSAGQRRVRITADTWRTASPLKALYALEMRDLLRSPVYLTQCLAGGLVLPLMLAIMIFTSNVNTDMAEISDMLHSITSQIDSLDMILILAAVMSFMSFVSVTAPTAVSREGARHAMNRSLPAAPRMLLQAKLLSALTVDAVVAVLTTLILMIGLHVTPMAMAAALLLYAVCRYASNALLLLLDVLHPMLNWKTETQAVKQNLNVLFAMLIGMLLIVLPVLAGVLLIGQGSMIRMAAVITVLAAEAAVGGILLHTIGEKRYAAIEP